MDTLPIELVLEICDFAAYSSFHSALALSLASTSVRRRTVRHLYATILLRSACQVEAFLNTLRGVGHECNDGTAKLFLNPAQYVRNLCITYTAPPAGWWTCVKVVNNPYAMILKYCSNVERAALQSTFLHSSLAPDHPVHKLNCKELTVIGPVWPSDWESHATITNNSYGRDIDTLEYQGISYHIFEGRRPGKSIQSSIFKHITHLHLLDPLSSPRTSCSFLSKLPCITHIALPAREPMRKNDLFWESTILIAAPQIKMIVFVYDLVTWIDKTWDIVTLAKLGRMKSNKLFAIRSTSVSEALSQWAGTTKGGDDIWSRARREISELLWDA